MQGSLGNGITNGHGSQVCAAPAAGLWIRDGRLCQSFQVEVKRLSQLIHVYLVYIGLRVAAVVVRSKLPEHVVGRNGESVNEAYDITVLAGLIVGDVGVLREWREYSVVGREGLVKTLYLAVLQVGHKVDGLEHGARLSQPAYCQVHGFFHPVGGGIPQKVDHRAYCSGLHVHHYGAAAFQLAVIFYLGA